MIDDTAYAIEYWNDGDRRFLLLDDGTLDTVIRVECTCGSTWMERISQETAAPFRDEDGYMVNFLSLCREYLDDTLCPNCEDSTAGDAFTGKQWTL